MRRLWQESRVPGAVRGVPASSWFGEWLQGGRGAGRLGAVAIVERQGAQLVSAHASNAARGRRAVKQAQSPRESDLEPRTAILEERVLGGTLKMAAPAGRIFPLPVSLEERASAAANKMAARVEVCEEVIVISDEEQERHDGLVSGDFDGSLQSVEQYGGRVSKGGVRKQSLDSVWCREVLDGNFGSQSVLKLGEQVEFTDQDGVIIRGKVCGQTSGSDHMGMAQVVMDFWQPGVEEDSAGFDAHRFQGGLSEVTVHREAGRPSGGQSLPVKVRAPLGHRNEGRVKSGAVYPTARESVAPGSLGHGAGSVFDGQPSTSRGAGARFESQHEEWLDYEEDVEERAIPVSNSVVKEAAQAVPEVVRGDRSGNRHQEMAGNLPRGEVGRGIGLKVGGAIGGLISRKGGVDVSIQVDLVAGTGAGKSEVAVDMVVGGVTKEDETSEIQDSVKSVGVVS
ncbi:hypothetical protein NDU88_005570 [Pleurodeles waltl]|uniref:Uncharacterized protein n=1 Tax=Pleurodeles waltl TaxID=8319 RepID=A0AAV7WV27_PLEWA|nr:hypothetical protein NDU88_005570 [Pleurodeles waltl]